MRERERERECVISRISRVLQETRKREIVGSIVGNNGTPKLPFPTSSSLCAELAVSRKQLRSMGFSTPSSTFALAYFALILMCLPPSPWININRRNPYVLVLHARGPEGLFLPKTFILTGPFAAVRMCVQSPRKFEPTYTEKG